MDSPAHRANIVDGKYREIGVGTAKGRYEGYDTVYVVQLFGTQAVPLAPQPTAPAVEPVGVETEIVPEPALVLASSSAPLATAERNEVMSEVFATPPTTELVTVESGSEILTASETVSAVAESLADTVSPVMTEEIDNPVVSLSSENTVVIETTLISTSSGLAIANITTEPQNHAGATLVSIATQPNELLQIAYLTLGALILFLLTISVVLEARRLHFMQVAYGVFLIIGMGGLWFVHTWLTSGAVIV